MLLKKEYFWIRHVLEVLNHIKIKQNRSPPYILYLFVLQIFILPLSLHSPKDTILSDNLFRLMV